MNYSPKLAYLCMEFGIDPNLKVYSGGLGILAGDTIKTYADLGMPAVGIGILYKHGYLDQTLDPEQGQLTHPQHWNPKHLLTKVGSTNIPFRNEEVLIDIWEYTYTSPLSNMSVSVLLLDTDIEGNSEEFRRVSHTLYSENPTIFYRQLLILGLGSKYALKALGCNEIDTYHLNESHSALICLALDHNQSRITFTTHTPLLAGHTRVPKEFLESYCKPEYYHVIPQSACTEDNMVNLTQLALSLSHYSNAVSEIHRNVSQEMFPTHSLDYITNGVHAPSWISDPIQTLLNTYVPHWGLYPEKLRFSDVIPLEKIIKVHQDNKKRLIDHIQILCNLSIRNPQSCFIGFARRATEYKRAHLIFSDLERLRTLTKQYSTITLIFAGKAYHHDPVGQDIIKRLLDSAHTLNTDSIQVLYLPNYDIELSKYLVSGVDVWLNTPRKPYEASGTSGMKASMNGVPNFSINDGWWPEGGIDGVNGWTIQGEDEASEITSLYQGLETILDMYTHKPEELARIRRSAIALIGSYFNTQRMMMEYITKGYDLRIMK